MKKISDDEQFIEVKICKTPIIHLNRKNPFCPLKKLKNVKSFYFNITLKLSAIKSSIRNKINKRF